MVQQRRQRSISFPIVLSAIAVALCVALLVGWIVVILKNLELTKQVAQNTVLLIAGVVSLAVIATVLVLFSVFLVREILEVRRQTSFVDSVTHELKSPLASLKLCLETLRRPELADRQREELREMMHADIERLASFIDDVLDASLIAHGKIARRITRLRLRALAESCVMAVVQRYKLPEQAVAIDIDAALLVSTDRIGLETALKNVLDNALKYSDERPDVLVRASIVNDALEIRVRDRGIGIPKRQVSRVFERFYRVPDELVRARRGTGLGLFVVAAIVRSLRGKVRAEPNGDGAGTTIVIVLPHVHTSEEIATTSHARELGT